MRHCFRCFKEIEDDENYYSFKEFFEQKEISNDFAHKVCWDEFLRRVDNVDEAMGIIRQLKKPLYKMGLIEEERYEIK